MDHDGVVTQGVCHCGAALWKFRGELGPATACNCTLCRRYGALWVYGYEGEAISITGPTRTYQRAKETPPVLETHFCGVCGCVLCWRGLIPEADGKRRIAVNARLAEPEAVAQLDIDHFDGLNTFEDLPRDGKCVRDLWA